jgi:hypothetical protein
MPINKLYEHSNTVPVGNVIRTEPESGTLVSPDAIVTLYISLGPGGWFYNSANADEAQKTRYAMFIAVSMDFPSAFVRVWSGFGQITILGQVYTGLGYLGRVSSVPERSNLTFERKTYQIAGAEVDPSLISETDLEGSFGRSVTEYLGFLDESGALLEDPEVLFEGEISNIRRMDGKESAIEVNAENRLTMLERVDGWRYTHEHQQQFYNVNPEDIGFNQVKVMATREIFWGGARVGGTYEGGGGGRRREGGGRR